MTRGCLRLRVFTVVDTHLTLNNNVESIGSVALVEDVTVCLVDADTKRACQLVERYWVPPI